MSEPMQSPAFQDRNQSFGTGMNGFQGETPAPVGSPGLQHQQAQENAAGPARVKMSGSMNGMADSQYKATLGGMFGTQNGQADSTYETKKYFPGGM